MVHTKYGPNTITSVRTLPCETLFSENFTQKSENASKSEDLHREPYVFWWDPAGVSTAFWKSQTEMFHKVVWEQKVSDSAHIWCKPSTSRLEKNNRSDFLFFASFARYLDSILPIFTNISPLSLYGFPIVIYNVNLVAGSGFWVDFEIFPWFFIEKLFKNYPAPPISM